jgi:hypothetical protein
LEEKRIKPPHKAYNKNSFKRGGFLMFLVFNKEKINAYLVSVITVILLFCVAGTLNSNKNTIQTSATAKKLLPIYNVKTEEKKVAFTMNCAW